MTPIAREVLAPSLDTFGRSFPLPEAYTDWSVFRWEQERFFDESWDCAGRSGEVAPADDGRVVGWHGWSFINARGDAEAFEDHVGATWGS